MAGAADDERRMTIVEHLEELRRVLIISSIAFVAATVAAFVFHGAIISFLLRPLTTVLGKNNHLTATAIYTTPTEGLTIPIKISAIVGLVGALPVILWQVWTFVSPGLRPVERRFVGPFIGSALLLFAGGAAFAYYVMPIGLNFLASFLGGDAIYLPDINAYLSFLLLLVVAFGVTFELPVVIILLGVLGLVSSRVLRRRRKGIWVAIIAASLIVTPGADPFTPTLLLVPLIAFFEAAVLILDKGLHR